MKVNFNSIIFKTVFSLLILSLIFVSFISFNSKYTFSSGYESLLNEKISIIQKSISPSLSLNMSYGFEKAIEEIAEKTLENENILLLKIDSNISQEKLIFTKYKKSISEYKEENQFVFINNLLDPATLEKIGKMTIIYSRNSYEEFMNKFYLWFVSALALFTLSMLFLSFYLFKSLRPLVSLATSLDDFNPNRPKQLSLEIDTSNEIGSISKSATAMIDKLINFLDYTKQLNIELSHNQSHLKEAQRMANIGSWEYIINQDKLILSDEIYRILKIKRSRLISKEEFQAHVVDKDKEYVQSVLSSAIKSGSNFNIKHSIKINNGDILNIHTKGKVRKKVSGSIRVTAVSMDITQDTKNKQTIEKLAYYDALTNLPNRTLLKDRIHKAIQLSDRAKNKTAIIFLDLDHFKLINDTLGHSIGDKLLIHVSKILKKQIRESDTLSRLGGDEFVILLPKIQSIHDAQNISEKILEAFVGQHTVDSHQLYITTSIGISIYPDNSYTLDELITNADTAMYDAKQDGRNKYKFYSKDMGNYISSQMRVEQDLKIAIDNKNELEIYYQPKIDAEGNFISGAEALIRWNHPTKGLMFPDEFIKVAESTGIILDIGKWVIKESVRQVKEWNKLGFTDLKVAVNLSAKQFQDSNLVPFIISSINEYSLDPSQLEFEITETLSMTNMEATLRILNELKSIDVSIAIDDFGTGYSSLAYLKKFPINILKIDKSFVIDMVEDKEDRVIVQTIISMAHSLGFTTVAEGVETQKHIDILKSLECDEFQGYFYSKAIPRDEFTQLLKNYTSLN